MGLGRGPQLCGTSTPFFPLSDSSQISSTCSSLPLVFVCSDVACWPAARREKAFRIRDLTAYARSVSTLAQAAAAAALRPRQARRLAAGAERQRRDAPRGLPPAGQEAPAAAVSQY